MRFALTNDLASYRACFCPNGCTAVCPECAFSNTRKDRPCSKVAKCSSHTGKNCCNTHKTTPSNPLQSHRHSARQISPLPLIVQRTLRLLPNCPDQFRLPLPGFNFASVFRRHTSQPLTNSSRIWLLPRNRSEVKRPQKAADSDEHTPLCNVHSLTNSATGAESEEISHFRVGVGGGFGEGLVQGVLVHIPLWLKAARIGVADWV
jgi:hypothetical protein